VPTTFVGAINVILLVFLKNREGFFADTSCATIYIPVAVLFITGLLMVSPLFLPKLQPRKNKAFNIFQAVLVLITYVSGFMFFTEKAIILEYLLLLVGCYMSIGLIVGLVQRSKIIEEAKASKK
jgi:CDP-diacylglycerol--serine O-phosphatidyltransferase